jgi:hypothetical protein
VKAGAAESWSWKSTTAFVSAREIHGEQMRFTAIKAGKQLFMKLFSVFGIFAENGTKKRTCGLAAAHVRGLLKAPPND